MVTATRTHTPVVTYHAQAETIVISHGFPIISVLRAGGYTFHAFTKTWRRKATAEQFAVDWDLLQNLGVVACPETAAWLTKPVQREYSKSTVETAPQQPAQPPRQAVPASKPSPMTRLWAAREIVMRIAASGRITDPEDLRDFRTVACAIKAIVDAQAESEWEDMEYGIAEEAASWDA